MSLAYLSLTDWRVPKRRWGLSSRGEIRQQEARRAVARKACAAPRLPERPELLDIINGTLGDDGKCHGGLDKKGVVGLGCRDHCARGPCEGGKRDSGSEPPQVFGEVGVSLSPVRRNVRHSELVRA